METKQEGNGEEQDLYFEHSQHFEKTEHCSECYKMIGVDFTNKKQENSLAGLRAKIAEQKQLRLFQVESNINKIEIPRLEKWEVPEITIVDGEEFNSERFEEVCYKANTSYHNFLVAQQDCKQEDAQSVCDFINALRDVSASIDEVVSEAYKVRYH